MYIEACINPSSTHALGFFNTHKVIFLHTQFNNPPDFSFQLFSISYVITWDTEEWILSGLVQLQKSVL